MRNRDIANQGGQAFDACRVSLGQPLVSVLRSLHVSGLEIVLIEDGQGLARGVFTDGDVRRALLSGATLESPVDEYVSSQFWAVSQVATRDEVLDLMQARRIGEVPVLDNGRFVGLHTLHELLGSVPRPNWAVIMAGGRGQRLQPLTDAVPKPMIKVAGRPILERLVLHLVGFGIQRIFLAVNYKADLIEEHFGAGSRFGCSIEYLREESPLGTAGALSLLPDIPEHPLLMLNGDLLTQFDVGGMLNFHARGGYSASMAVHSYSHTIPFGVVRLDDDRVVRIQEKPTEVWPTNAGIYVLGPGLAARVPRGSYHLVTALLEDCLARGESVGAFQVDDEWIDVGRHDDLERARGGRQGR